MSEIVAVDVGGTHARFAFADVQDGRVVSVSEPSTLETAQHESFEAAWEAFRSQAGRSLPAAAAIAFAGPVSGETLELTNSRWKIRPAELEGTLGLERCLLINDLGAVAHAVPQLEPRWFRHLCGPEHDLPAEGVISIVGPGTGLGVAQLILRDGDALVIETEGGHIGFAPADDLDDLVLSRLRSRFGRASAERVASGPGLRSIHEAVAAMHGVSARFADERSLWKAAIAREDELAAAALDRFCRILGAVAGDIALAQGASCLVISGGVGLRLADQLPGSAFREGFTAKGRFQAMMEQITAKVILHPQPGLLGAAAAFAAPSLPSRRSRDTFYGPADQD